MSVIHVIKRDGSKVPLDISKIQTQVARACEGISDVSPSMIELAAKIQFTDGMKTEDIDRLLLQAMVNLIDVTQNPDINHTNYQFVAGKQRLAMLRKEVYGRYTPPRLYDIVRKNVEVGLYTPELLQWYSESEWDQIDRFVNHKRDEDLSYAAVEQLTKKYLVQNRATKEIFETPQVRYAVAAATAFHMEKHDRLKYVKDYYNHASYGHFSLATPVLAGLGTPTKQFSSCVLITANDSLQSIFATGEMMAYYAANRAGLGLEIGSIRGLGAPVKNGAIEHTGLVPFLKKWFGDMRSCSQGGIRNASCTVTLPIFHYQFDDFIVLKNNQGVEENRVRHMDYCVAVNAYFWNRFKNKENITFFDPNECRELFDAFYTDTEEFIRLYEKYERKTSVRKKTVPAEVVFKEWIIKERSDTGRIYLLYIDNVIRQTPFNVLTHPIRQTNLCVEILLPTASFERIEDPAGRIALCTLGSMNWGSFKNPEDIAPACYILVRALSNILGYQDFLSIQSRLSNEEFEPLGVGVTNLAYWHAKRGLQYGTPEALAEVKRWMEHQAYYLTEASVQLAEERGACKLSHTTCYGQGIFPWEKRAVDVDELTSFEPELDWEPLRDRMKRSGIRNATLMAIAPVESSSVVIDSTNGIEMPLDLISVKDSKAGAFVQVVPEYTKLKNKYQLMWDQTDCIDYIKTACVLAAYVDQSISTNTFYSPKHFPHPDPAKNFKVPTTLVAKNLMLAHKWGLRTFYYSLMDKQGSKAGLEDAPLLEGTPIESLIEEEDDCLACKL